MTDLDALSAKLHPLEREVLPKISANTSFDDIVRATGLKDVEVMRALQWLQNKGVIELSQEIKEVINLDSNGKKYTREGLPERKFLEAVRDKPLALEELGGSGLSRDEINICIGLLKSKAAIDIKKDAGLIISINPNGKRLLEGGFLEESFLRAGFPRDASSLGPEEKFAFEALKKRKNIVREDVIKLRSARLTPIGEALQKTALKTDVVDSITPAMLKSGSWKGKDFRSYDIRINVPRISGGRRHFVREVTEYVKKIWLELGFKEMTGPMVQTSFWNFDALFTAQDHPTRDLQDTFYVRNPAKGKLPAASLVSNVQKTHENGWTTGSKGWEYSWNPELAKENVMRTHTTVLSAQTIAKLKESGLPAKYFAVGKCFRNETLDWSHLFEFNQVEGIVVDPDANFKHLVGYLKEFFKKMGYKVRIRPAYFPYTEPSAEVDIYDPRHRRWIELAGSGMFRPELVKPLLGKAVPVLAWGLGLSRLVPMYYGMDDIRELYKNDLRQLREIKSWMR
ncbi:MAG: phenylalanine--tRNA ligase subunit alpha [archaeon]